MTKQLSGYGRLHVWTCGEAEWGWVAVPSVWRGLFIWCRLQRGLDANLIFAFAAPAAEGGIQQGETGCRA